MPPDRPGAGVTERAMQAAASADLSPEQQELLRRLLRKRVEARRGAERVQPRAGDGPAPLSFAQRRLWFVDQLEPESAAYNLPFALRLRGELRVEALERALSAIMRRHEALRTVFPARDGEPVQTVREPEPFVLPVGDLRTVREADREAALRRLARAEADRPFDLARGPLLRAVLVRLGEAEWGLLGTMHHIASDGWSIGVLVREVSELYAAFAEDRAPSLPPLPVQYADYAVWQRGWLAGEALERQLAWWREALAGAPAHLELPTDHPRRSRTSCTPRRAIRSRRVTRL